MAKLQSVALIAVAVAIIAGVVLMVAYNQFVVNTSTPIATGDDKLLVITSVAPISNIIENIGGSNIDILQVVPDSQDSHTFKLSVTDSVIVKTRADIVIINGLYLEDTIEQAALEAENPDLRLLKLADNTITRDQWAFDHSFPEEQGKPNPHLWLNVQYAMKYAQLIRDELSLADPDNAQYYDANANKYLAKLEQLDKAILQSVQTIPEQNRKLITYHDSFPYFAERYGFKVIAALQPAHFGEPTDAEITAIIAQIKQENVPAIFASEVFPNDVTQRLADEADVEVVRTLRDDSLPGNLGASQHTYVGMMAANVRTMVAALGGDPTSLEEIDPSNTADA
jgi:ABC-type Zn uptake system ZnuABC Zn-binding protein ZnuA